MILSGHPTGNPNSHNAFAAFGEAKLLKAICVPWIPSRKSVDFLRKIAPLNRAALRLARRCYDLPHDVECHQDRVGEVARLLLRLGGSDAEGLAYKANDWLMHKMRQLVNTPYVTAVHSYEDCSLLQFEEARHLGKACIYDMPIGYYKAWEILQNDLEIRFSDWIPYGGRIKSRFARPDQKDREMRLADTILVPSAFVADTISQFFPAKQISIARYGVDANFWRPSGKNKVQAPVRFLYAGQCSVRKGTPLLLEAWRAANLQGSELQLVGGWHLNSNYLGKLPANVHWSGPVDPFTLREQFWRADCFVSPTFFEGRALVIAEAMACGLPVITTPSSGCEDLVGDGCGFMVPTGNFDALVDALRCAADPDKIVRQAHMARRRAAGATWQNYQGALIEAVAPYV